MNDPQYRSLGETARFTRLSVRTIQSAIARGDLAAIHVGRRVLIDNDSIAAWLTPAYAAGGDGDDAA